MVRNNFVPKERTLKKQPGDDFILDFTDIWIKGKKTLKKHSWVHFLKRGGSLRKRSSAS